MTKERALDIIREHLTKLHSNADIYERGTCTVIYALENVVVPTLEKEIEQSRSNIDFRLGDWVYADDWFYGRIVSIDDDEAFVEFETAGGGGSFAFKLCELRRAPKPKKRRIK